MLVMAKKATAGGSKKAPARSGKNINIWIDQDLYDAFEAYKKSQRLPVYITDFTELAFRDLLEKEGFWPPK